ncbi:hypothetical protein SUGI_0574660 [Cryptomeria japonica]|nr:hypothetical protein SUGI_0574660 [Cryptomeria japonica]
MLGVLDVLYSSAEYIPSSTRNIPLMIRQLSLLARRFFSYLLRTAEDMRDSHIRPSYLEQHAWERDIGTSATTPWSNLTAACFVY